MIFFLHIPKTAGTSVRQIITQAIKPAAVLVPQSPLQVTYLTDHDLSVYPLIAGHAGFALIRRLRPPVQTITFLRDPVARVVSQYRYFVDCARDTSTKLNPYGSILRGRSLEEMLQDPSDPFVELFFRELQTFSLHSDGWMYYRKAVAHLPRSEVLEQAKRNLEKIDVLGLVERMDESVRRMRAHFGWPEVEVPHEMRSSTGSAVEISPKLAGLIREHNPMDVELYEYAVQLFDSRAA